MKRTENNIKNQKLWRRLLVGSVSKRRFAHPWETGEDTSSARLESGQIAGWFECHAEHMATIIQVLQTVQTND